MADEDSADVADKRVLQHASQLQQEWQKEIEQAIDDVKNSKKNRTGKIAYRNVVQSLGEK